MILHVFGGKATPKHGAAALSGITPSFMLPDPPALSPQLEPCYWYGSAPAVRRGSNWKKILGGIVILLFGGGVVIF